jgi:hypothetical protein
MIFDKQFGSGGYSREAPISDTASIQLGNLTMPNQQNNEPTHLFVTMGSRSERGGCASHVATKAEYRGLAPLRGGNTVVYDDGSEAAGVDGAGCAVSRDGRPFAIVGSRLSNGDWVTETTQDGGSIKVHSGKPVPGLFYPAYVPSLPDSAC